MKKISLLAATAILFTAAAETIQLEILNNNGFEKTTAKGAIRDWTYNPYSKQFNGGGSFTSVPNGYKGKAAKLKCSEGQRIYLCPFIFIFSSFFCESAFSKVIKFSKSKFWFSLSSDIIAETICLLALLKKSASSLVLVSAKTNI